MKMFDKTPEKVFLSTFLSEWLQKCEKKPSILNFLATEQNSVEITNKLGSDSPSKISWFITNFQKIKVKSYQAPNMVDFLDMHFVLKNLNQSNFIESDLTQNLLVCALDCVDKLGKSIFVKQKHPCAENELYYKKLKVEGYSGVDKDLDNFNFSSLTAMNMNKKNFSNYIRILCLCLTNQLFRDKMANDLFFIENIRHYANILSLNNDFVSNIKLTNFNLSKVIASKFKNKFFKPLAGKIIIESYIDSVVTKKKETTEFLNQVLMNQNFLNNFGIVQLIALVVEKLNMNIDDILIIFTDNHSIKEIQRWLPTYRIIEKYLRFDKTMNIDYNELTYLFSGMISDSFHGQLDIELHPISMVFFSSLMEIEIDWDRMIIETEESNIDINDKEFFNFYISLAKRFTTSIKSRLFDKLKEENSITNPVKIVD